MNKFTYNFCLMFEMIKLELKALSFSFFSWKIKKKEN